MVAAFVGGGAALVAGGLPSSRRPIAAIWLEAADAMRRLCPRGSRVLVRPSRDYPPDWLLEGHVTYVELPAAVGDGEIFKWVRANADFALTSEASSLFERLCRLPEASEWLLREARHPTLWGGRTAGSGVRLHTTEARGVRR